MSALLQAGQTGSLPGYGLMLLQSLLALAAICVLAWVVLRWGAGLLRKTSSQRIKVLERIALDNRRTLYLVHCQDTVMLLGAADSGINILAKYAASDFCTDASETQAEENS